MCVCVCSIKVVSMCVSSEGKRKVCVPSEGERKVCVRVVCLVEEREECLIN